MLPSNTIGDILDALGRVVAFRDEMGACVLGVIVDRAGTVSRLLHRIEPLPDEDVLDPAPACPSCGGSTWWWSPTAIYCTTCQPARPDWASIRARLCRAQWGLSPRDPRHPYLVPLQITLSHALAHGDAVTVQLLGTKVEWLASSPVAILGICEGWRDGRERWAVGAGTNGGPPGAGAASRRGDYLTPSALKNDGKHGGADG